MREPREPVEEARVLAARVVGELVAAVGQHLEGGQERWDLSPQVACQDGEGLGEGQDRRHERTDLGQRQHGRALEQRLGVPQRGRKPVRRWDQGPRGRPQRIGEAAEIDERLARGVKRSGQLADRSTQCHVLAGQRLD